MTTSRRRGEQVKEAREWMLACIAQAYDCRTDQEQIDGATAALNYLIRLARKGAK